MEAEVVEGCRAVGFTLGVPALSMLGMVDEVLADRAFVEQRQNSAAELATLARPAGRRPERRPALRRQRARGRGAGAGLRRRAAVGARRAAHLPPRPAPHRRGRHRRRRALRQRLQGHQPARRRRLAARLRVRRLGGRAACSRAPEAARRARRSASPPRLRGVVLIGADRARIAEALARHAPDVPVVDLDPSETVACTMRQDLPGST